MRHASEEREPEAASLEPGPTRYVAPGGWRRALIGFLVGLLAGALVALLLPRDEGPRRRDLSATRPPTPDPLEPPAAR